MANNYGEELVNGLKTTVPMNKIGDLYFESTQGLAEKISDLIRTTYGVPECDKIIITPKLARNSTGISDVTVTAYFATDKAGGNVFYQGRGGRNKNSEGRVNVVAASGAGGGTGLFNTKPEFDSIMKPLCKIGDNGKPQMHLKSVPGIKNIAALELDFSSVLCLALGIKPNDQYDFMVLQMVPIANTQNYSMICCKYFINNGGKKGKNSGINYARIEQDLFRRVNNGNNGNNGGRNY
jgi:hypothetical protein